MQTISIFSKRHLRICYWDAENKFLGTNKAVLERRLTLLGDVTFAELKGLDDPKFSPCDLLIVAADKIPEDNFPKWLNSLQRRVKSNHNIWTPALILADLSFRTLDSILTMAVKSNWYFDILDVNHIDSLPIRVANLLRIHDHLHELRRYGEQLSDLTKTVNRLETELEKYTST